MTLTRVLEPEVMDTAEDAADYDAMDHREVNQRFVADLLGAGELGDLILDLGTGTARIPIDLCRQHAGCRVAAVDLSVSMLDLARLNVEVAGLIGRIQLAQVDAKQLPYPDGQFTTVISNSIIHHIPDPRAVLAEAIRVTAPGGLLFFRDLFRPADDATLRHLVATYAGQENDHARQLFADSLRAALSLDEIRGLVASLGFAPAAVQATSDRHWTWFARK